MSIKQEHVSDLRNNFAIAPASLPVLNLRRTRTDLARTEISSTTIVSTRITKNNNGSDDHGQITHQMLI